jgi:alginate O-acetyltransferase complex protein AlgI
MLFNSFNFLLFFPAVTLAFYVLPHRLRWGMLLAASCFFYMFFKPVYILILFFTIVVDYFAGLFLEKTQDPVRKKQLLLASLVANIGVLAIFKYYNFLNGNLSDLLGIFGRPNPVPFLEILLPIGLSFHTFQAMSYTVEVYRGRQKAERHFGIYALYVMFYPQLVAGPIERPQHILHQIHEYHPFRYDNASAGMKRMLYGFFKKLVVADRLSIYVDTIYRHPERHTATTLIVATVFFAIQVYCDFSAYSDIAIGSARVMGFDLMENFRRPFFSSSVQELWTRWHISLSSWFRDYLYIPLGGSRVPRWRMFLNLLIVFGISGLWHGASWNYVVFGLIHGTFVIADQLVSGPARTAVAPRGARRVLAMLWTFTLFSFTMIFFRARTFDQSVTILQGIAALKPGFFVSVPLQFAYCLIAIAMLFAIEVRDEFFPQRLRLFDSPNVAMRYASYAALAMIVLLTGVFDGGQFIYFQF